MGHKAEHTERKVGKGRIERKYCDRQQRQRRKILNRECPYCVIYKYNIFTENLIRTKWKKVKHDNIHNRISICTKRHTDGK